MTPNSGYEATAQSLTDRIYALIPEHSEILTITNPFDLFHFGLKCDDLAPTLAQAQSALAVARQRWRAFLGPVGEKEKPDAD